MFLSLPVIGVQIWFLRHVSPYHLLDIHIFCIIRPQASRKKILFPGLYPKLG